MDEFALPFWSSTPWLVGVFFGALILLHLLLVRWVPLSVRRWKQVDYVWLAIAAIGLFGALETPRAIASRGRESLAQFRLDFAVQQLYDSAQFGTSIATCRTFSPSSLMAEADRHSLQAEFDGVCNWFKLALEQVANRRHELTSANEPVELDLPKRPETDEEQLVFEFASFDRALQDVHQYKTVVKEMRQAQQETDFETTLKILGPFFVAFALALRITKVTGELRGGVSR